MRFKGDVKKIFKMRKIVFCNAKEFVGIMIRKSLGGCDLIMGRQDTFTKEKS